MTRRPPSPSADPTRSSPPALVISLDFELFWGRFDTTTIEAYRANLLGVRQVVPRLLALFEQRGIHATWATVGFLFFGNKRDLLAGTPNLRPEYIHPRNSPYEHLATVGDEEESDPFHFGLSLIELIRRHRGQEIATHTIAHHCCLEPGHTPATFAADLEAACRAAGRRGIPVKSIVFPRNQYSEPYLKICRQHGLRSFRGNEDSWIYRARPTAEQRPLLRLVRLLDSYLPLSGYHGFPAANCVQPDLADIPSSRFLRPYLPRLRALESLRFRRIAREMRAAARRGDVFHLWWHPHNFGTHQDENFRFLERILDTYSELSSQYGMQSLNMMELASQLPPHSA